MAAVNGLTVRRYERHEVGLPAVLSLTGSACHAVRFSATSETDGQGIPATLVDIGDGGLGVRTSVMLPRGTTLRVRVTHPQGNELLLEVEARLQRLSMKGREPSYLLGMAFVNPPANIAEQVSRTRACAAANPSVGAGEGAC